MSPCQEDNVLVNQLISELHSQAGLLNGLPQALLDATIEDLQCWMQKGLDQRPFFDKTLAHFKIPLPGEPLFFLASMRATNGPDPEGYRLEMVTGYRRETPYLIDAEQYTNRYVAPFQCIKLGAASKGFLQGNCIVLFPESVSTSCKIQKQTFALFFFSKFFHIYNHQTVVETDRLFGRNSKYLFGQLLSRHMNAHDMYDARCLWGYYHDYAHHCGPRPLEKNLYLKLNWFTGVLEEIKCDLITLLLVQKHRTEFWREIIEFILLERMFRYPMGSSSRMTFDAGTGILLFEILMNTKALVESKNGYFKFDIVRLEEQITALISDILSLEVLDDESYLIESKMFIQHHLGVPQGAQARFNLSNTQYARRVLKEVSGCSV